MSSISRGRNLVWLKKPRVAGWVLDKNFTQLKRNRIWGATKNLKRGWGEQRVAKTKKQCSGKHLP